MDDIFLQTEANFSLEKALDHPMNYLRYLKIILSDCHGRSRLNGVLEEKILDQLELLIDWTGKLHEITWYAYPEIRKQALKVEIDLNIDAKGGIPGWLSLFRAENPTDLYNCVYIVDVIGSGAIREIVSNYLEVDKTNELGTARDKNNVFLHDYKNLMNFCVEFCMHFSKTDKRMELKCNTYIEYENKIKELLGHE